MFVTPHTKACGITSKLYARQRESMGVHGCRAAWNSRRCTELNLLLDVAWSNQCMHKTVIGQCYAFKVRYYKRTQNYHRQTLRRHGAGARCYTFAQPDTLRHHEPSSAHSTHTHTHMLNPCPAPAPPITAMRWFLSSTLA